MKCQNEILCNWWLLFLKLHIFNVAMISTNYLHNVTSTSRGLGRVMTILAYTYEVFIHWFIMRLINLLLSRFWFLDRKIKCSNHIKKRILYFIQRKLFFMNEFQWKEIKIQIFVIFHFWFSCEKNKNRLNDNDLKLKWEISDLITSSFIGQKSRKTDNRHIRMDTSRVFKHPCLKCIFCRTALNNNIMGENDNLKNM